MVHNAAVLITIIFYFPGPNPVSNILTLIDSTNVTLEWPKPEGRIERYIIKWQPDGSPELEKTKNISEQNIPAEERSSIFGSEEKPVRILIGELMPGVKYLFEIYTTSYFLESDVIKLSARTMPQIQSEVLVVNDMQVMSSLYKLIKFKNFSFLQNIYVFRKPIPLL